MTEPTREQMRADLARAMGWKEGSVVWFSPDNGNAICVEDEPPDPFTNAADNRALVEWIATQNALVIESFVRSSARKEVTRFQPLQGIARFYRYRPPLRVCLNRRVAK